VHTSKVHTSKVPSSKVQTSIELIAKPYKSSVLNKKKNKF